MLLPSSSLKMFCICLIQPITAWFWLIFFSAAVDISNFFLLQPLSPLCIIFVTLKVFFCLPSVLLVYTLKQLQIIFFPLHFKLLIMNNMHFTTGVRGKKKTSVDYWLFCRRGLPWRGLPWRELATSQSWDCRVCWISTLCYHYFEEDSIYRLNFNEQQSIKLKKNLKNKNKKKKEQLSTIFLWTCRISWGIIFHIAIAGKATKVQNELLTWCAISRGFPPLMRIPFCAATPVPTITAVGVARPKEQGHAMLSTVIEVWNANLSIISAFEMFLLWFCKKREKKGEKIKICKITNSR